jgi:hypothetical protein
MDLRHDVDRGRPLEEQKEIHKFLEAHELGIQAALKTNDFHKSQFDKALVESDFSSVGSYVIELENPPDVMCSGGFFPEQDFEGRQLQDVSDVDQTLQLLTVTSFASRGHGYIVFAWLSESDKICGQFIRSLEGVIDDQGSNAFLRLVFEHFENVHLRPEWWEGLTQEQRRSFAIRMATSAHPELPRKNKYLMDDGIGIPRWNIVSSYYEPPA